MLFLILLAFLYSLYDFDGWSLGVSQVLTGSIKPCSTALSDLNRLLCFHSHSTLSCFDYRLTLSESSAAVVELGLIFQSFMHTAVGNTGSFDFNFSIRQLLFSSCHGLDCPFRSGNFATKEQHYNCPKQFAFQGSFDTNIEILQAAATAEHWFFLLVYFCHSLFKFRPFQQQNWFISLLHRYSLAMRPYPLLSYCNAVFLSPQDAHQLYCLRSPYYQGRFLVCLNSMSSS